MGTHEFRVRGLESQRLWVLGFKVTGLEPSSPSE